MRDHYILRKAFLNNLASMKINGDLQLNMESKQGAAKQSVKVM